MTTVEAICDHLKKTKAKDGSKKEPMFKQKPGGMSRELFVFNFNFNL